jgi:hypothetical protein
MGQALRLHWLAIGAGAKERSTGLAYAKSEKTPENRPDHTRETRPACPEETRIRFCRSAILLHGLQCAYDGDGRIRL